MRARSRRGWWPSKAQAEGADREWCLSLALEAHLSKHCEATHEWQVRTHLGAGEASSDLIEAGVQIAAVLWEDRLHNLLPHKPH